MLKADKWKFFVQNIDWRPIAYILSSAQMTFMSDFYLCMSWLQCTSSGKAVQRREYDSQNSMVKNKLFSKFIFLWPVHLDYPHDSEVIMNSKGQRTLSVGHWNGMCQMGWERIKRKEKH